MRVLLANDTSQTNNPGCKGTIAGLRHLIEAAGHRIVVSLPVGYGQDLFRNCLAASLHESESRFVRRIKSILSDWGIRAAWAWKPPLADLKRWYESSRELGDRFQGDWNGFDIVAINGEGTLHHNQPSALALLALAFRAKEEGKRVWLINCTIQYMEERLMRFILPLCDYIAVREPATHRWLSELGFSVKLSADCAFLLGIQPVAQMRETRKCLYTPGVLTVSQGSGRITSQRILKQIKLLQKCGWNVAYLTVETDDNVVLDSVRRTGIQILELGSTNHQNIGLLLRDYDLVVSGRYHILIFASMAGIPLIPMQSNTWKIEGLIEQLGCHKQPVRNLAGLRSWLQEGPFKTSHINLKDLSQKARMNSPTGSTYALNTVNHSVLGKFQVNF